MWGTSCFQKRKKRTLTNFPIFTESKERRKHTVIYLNFENIVSLNKTIKINNVNRSIQTKENKTNVSLNKKPLRLLARKEEGHHLKNRILCITTTQKLLQYELKVGRKVCGFFNVLMF